MAESDSPAGSMPPSAPTGGRTRSGSQIPRAWTVPAESFSEPQAPASVSPWIAGLVAAGAAVALVVTVSLVSSPAATTTTTTTRQRPTQPPATTTTPVAPTTTTTPPIALATTTTPPIALATTTTPIAPATTPPIAPVTTAPAPTTTTPAPSTTTPAPSTTTKPTPGADTRSDDAVPPSRLRARSLVGKARRAARDGKRDLALRLAEQAVAVDDRCGGCWRTLALLRRQTGNHAGAAAARTRANEATDPLP
jgi:hypothetical protein